MTPCWDHIECDSKESGFIRPGSAEQVGPPGAAIPHDCRLVPALSPRGLPHCPPFSVIRAHSASPKENAL
jgi:hypothetical protein